MISARLKSTGEIVTGQMAIRALAKGLATPVAGSPEFRRAIVNATKKAD